MLSGAICCEKPGCDRLQAVGEVVVVAVHRHCVVCRPPPCDAAHAMQHPMCMGITRCS